VIARLLQWLRGDVEYTLQEQMAAVRAVIASEPCPRLRVRFAEPDPTKFQVQR
jgi:hypothetical protein